MSGDTSKIKLTKKTTRRLLQYAKPYFGLFLVAFLAIAILIGLSLYQPILLGEATDVIVDNAGSFTQEIFMQIVIIGLKYLACVLLTFGISYLQSMMLAYIGQKVIYKIRLDVFKHLHKLDISFFNNNPIGRLVTRATNDVETLSELYSSVIVTLVRSVGTLIGIVITMLTFNLELSLITFTTIPVIIVITVIFTNILMKNWSSIRSKISSLNAFVSEHVSGMKIIQIFTAEKKTYNKFTAKTEELRKSHMKQIVTHSVYGPSIYLLNILATVLLIIFGSKMYMAGAITIGTIVTFQRYIGRFFDPIQEFAEQLNVIQSSKVSAQRIFGLLDEQSSILEKEDAIELDDIKGEIEFKNVWFAYKDEDWILKDVSFKIEAGQSVAFVGATGAGKTTIQNLIGRYYDIQKGEILLDGINIKDIKIDSLRIKIGQMLQDVFLFTGDIESNIRLKNEEIGQDELIASAKYVNADSFISKMKLQYKEPVLEGGTSLSAGQRQLISFARTLAYKPRILILDEATANIDTETELLIQDALKKIMEGRTTLIVAHRLSTIQNCDNIIVMHKGKIVEQGNHQQLLKQKGIYFKLYKLQYENSEN
ncbi:MAG TPA: ABC transporter ATP-binding protein [Clostridia bacterium]|nr:ABC transporter ATP-binding protein [Clostridia bacterium]